MSDRARVIEDLPKMTASSVPPAVRRQGARAWIAYPLAPEVRFCALVRFDGVESLTFGYPNDEGLRDHPLYGQGRRPYEFHEVLPADGPGRRFVTTFHDGTLNVIAETYAVETAHLEADDACAALIAELGPGPADFLG